MNIRIPDPLVDAVRHLAQGEGRSLNGLVAAAVREYALSRGVVEPAAPRTDDRQLRLPVEPEAETIRQEGGRAMNVSSDPEPKPPRSRFSCPCCGGRLCSTEDPFCEDVICEGCGCTYPWPPENGCCLRCDRTYQSDGCPA